MYHYHGIVEYQRTESGFSKDFSGYFSILVNFCSTILMYLEKAEYFIKKKVKRK